jgi:hypothetical protein
MKKIGFLSALVASAAALLLGACNDDNDAPKPPVDLPTEVTVGDQTLELKSFYAMYFGDYNMIFLYATPEEGLVGEEVLSAEETLCVGLTPDFLNKTVDLLAAPSEGMLQIVNYCFGWDEPYAELTPDTASGIVDNAKLKVGYAAGELQVTLSSTLLDGRKYAFHAKAPFDYDAELRPDNYMEIDEVREIKSAYYTDAEEGSYLYFTPADLSGLDPTEYIPSGVTSCASLYFDESLMIGEQYDIASVSRPFEIRIDLNSVDGNNITHRISNGDLGGATGTFTVTRSGGTAGKFTVELDIRGLGSYNFKLRYSGVCELFAAATKANEYGYAGLAQEEIGSVIIDQRNAAKHSVWITCDRGVTDIEDFDNNWVSEFVRLEYSPVHPTIGNSVYDGTLIGFSQDDAAAIVFEDNTWNNMSAAIGALGSISVKLDESQSPAQAVIEFRAMKSTGPATQEPVFGGYYKGKVTVVK